MVAQQDVPGSADHPLITRYPGAYIDWHEIQEFEQYKIATGPVTGYRHIDEWLEVEGKMTRIYYVIKGKRSITEVYQNYANTLKREGFTILAKGLHNSRNVGKTVGGRTWMGVHYKANPLPPNGKINLLNGSSTVGGSSFIAGKLDRPDRNGVCRGRRCPVP